MRRDETFLEYEDVRPRPVCKRKFSLDTISDQELIQY